MLQYRVTFQLKSPIFWSILYSPRTICTITQDKISFLQGQDPPVENDIKLSCLQLFPSKNSCVCRIKWWSCWVCQNANSYTTNYSSTNFCLRVSCKLFGYIFIVCLGIGVRQLQNTTQVVVSSGKACVTLWFCGWTLSRGHHDFSCHVTNDKMPSGNDFDIFLEKLK